MLADVARTGRKVGSSAENSAYRLGQRGDRGKPGGQLKNGASYPQSEGRRFAKGASVRLRGRRTTHLARIPLPEDCREKRELGYHRRKPWRRINATREEFAWFRPGRRKAPYQGGCLREEKGTTARNLRPREKKGCLCRTDFPLSQYFAEGDASPSQKGFRIQRASQTSQQKFAYLARGETPS